MLLALPAFAQTAPTVFFQAHRGGLDEAPENTLAAAKHAWSVPGAIPEVDVRTTKDGYLICLHDSTLARTTNTPGEWRDKNVSELPLADVESWDAGTFFSVQFSGERVATLASILKEMKGHPDRQVYLDLKAVDLDTLAALIDRYGVLKQVIFVAGNQERCQQIEKRFPGTRTMTWLSGAPVAIKHRFERLAKSHFKGISQLQFHLKGKKTAKGIVYDLDPDFLRQAVATTRKYGVDLQVRPFIYDAQSLKSLLDLGIHWYVTDAPEFFHKTVAQAQALQK